MTTSKVKVPVVGGGNKVITLSPGATVGATIGSDLFMPDGSVATLASLYVAINGAAPIVAPQFPVPLSAAPTALVGLAPIRGTAKTMMQSDSAPALDQSISPTMTGFWTFTHYPNFGGGPLIPSGAAPVMPQEDPEDHLLIPGPTGPQGSIGRDGRPGLDGESGEDGMAGPPGIAGATGGQGPQGAATFLQCDDGEDQVVIPGPAGPQGAIGNPGVQGVATFLQAEDAEDAVQIPGPPGPAGVAGGAGAQGVALYFEADQAEDQIPIPGPIGPQGAQGPAGPGGSGAVFIPEGADEELRFAPFVGGTIGSNFNWSGNHAFTPGSGTAVVINEVAGADGLLVLVPSGSATDRSVNVVWSGHYNLFNVFNDGHGLLGWNGTAAILTWSAAGNVVINTPSSGAALKINAVDNTAAFSFDDAAAAFGYYVGFSMAASLKAGIGIGGVVITGATLNSLNFVAGIASTGDWMNFSANAGTSIQMQLKNTGLILNAIASQQGVVINAATGCPAAYSATNLVAGLQMNSSGSNWGMVQNDGANTWSLATGTSLTALGTPILQWNTAGVSIYEAGYGVAALTGAASQGSGTFTGTLTVGTNTTTGTIAWSRVGNFATLSCADGLTTTANGASQTLTGMPAGLRPAGTRLVPSIYVSNSNTFPGDASVGTGGTLTFQIGSPLGNPASTGICGLPAGWSVTYPVN